MNIREVTKSDAADLSKIAAQTYKETFGHSFTPEELETQIQETRSEQYFLSALQKDTILVAEQDGQTIGYVQICDMKITVKEHTVDKGSQAINAIYIAAAHQGKGIGKRLMDEAFKHPRIVQSKSVYIDVWEENERAVNFYKNYGFSVVGKCDVVVDGKTVGEDLVLAKHTGQNK